MRRPAGTGQVEQLPSGAWRARIVVDGKRRTLGPFASREEAEAVLDEARRQIASGEVHPVGGTTVRGYLEEWADRRERERRWPESYRAMLPHLTSASWSTTPLKLLRRAELREWIADFARRPLMSTGRSPSHGTTKLVWAVLRRALQEALGEDRIDANPCLGVEVPRKATGTDATWTYLTIDEQDRVLAAFEGEDRDAVAFTIGAGVRCGEFASIELRDVVAFGSSPQIVVRYGGPRHAPTKSKRIRTVPLFGIALDAVRAQLARLADRENPRRLLWPRANGEWRDLSHPLGTLYPNGRSKPQCRWRLVVRALDLGRRVRWHDLRHTCASSLVAGWWGRAWRIEEVRDLLGHASVAETERYAHLAPSVLAEAASGTRGPRRSPREAHDHRNDAKMQGSGMSGDYQPYSGIPGDSGWLGDSVGFAWGSPLLRAQVVEALAAVAAKAPGAGEIAADAVVSVEAARRAQDPVLATIDGARSRGVAGLVEVLGRALDAMPATQRKGPATRR